PGMSVMGVLGSGAVFVYSGATGKLIYREDGISGGSLGGSVAGVGDVDGDGRADFAASGAAVTDTMGTTAGSVYVYSGRTGSLLYNLFGSAALESFGTSITSLGDVDGDGRPDILVG